MNESFFLCLYAISIQLREELDHLDAALIQFCPPLSTAQILPELSRANAALEQLNIAFQPYNFFLAVMRGNTGLAQLNQRLENRSGSKRINTAMKSIYKGLARLNAELERLSSPPRLELSLTDPCGQQVVEAPPPYPVVDNTQTRLNPFARAFTSSYVLASDLGWRPPHPLSPQVVEAPPLYTVMANPQTVLNPCARAFLPSFSRASNRENAKEEPSNDNQRNWAIICDGISSAPVTVAVAAAAAAAAAGVGAGVGAGASLQSLIEQPRNVFRPANALFSCNEADRRVATTTIDEVNEDDRDLDELLVAFCNAHPSY